MVLRVSVVTFLLMIISGCYTVKIEAPPGSVIKILPSMQSAPPVMKYRVWYAFWGSVPLSEVSTAPKLQGKKLSAVAIKTEFEFVDFVVDIFLGLIGIGVRTVEINGY